jgi:hypothetical protein
MSRESAWNQRKGGIMLRKVGAFWTAKSGKGYTGKLSEDVAEGARLYLGDNKKTKDSQPDMQLFIIEDDEKEEQPPF